MLSILCFTGPAWFRGRGNKLTKCSDVANVRSSLNASQMRCIIEQYITSGEFIMVHTSMLHVRVEDELKADAAEKLACFGLTLSDAVRILLTRITKEGGLPVGLTVDPEAHDAWFRAKVQEALADTRPTAPHQQVMDAAQALIDRKRRRA